MNIGDRIPLSRDEFERVTALERRHGDEELDLHRRHRNETADLWQSIRKAHPELEGCLLKHFGDSLYVLRAPDDRTKPV